MSEDDEIIQFRIDEERAEYLNEQRDAYFQAWRKDNIKVLESDFCENNDDFEQFCRDEFKRYGDE